MTWSLREGLPSFKPWLLCHLLLRVRKSFKRPDKLDAVPHTFNPSPWERRQENCFKFKGRLDYTGRPCLEKPNQLAKTELSIHESKWQR